MRIAARRARGGRRRRRGRACSADTLCLHGDNPAAVANAARRARRRWRRRASRSGRCARERAPRGCSPSATPPSPSSSATRSTPRSTRACARSTRALRARPFAGLPRGGARPTRRCSSSTIPRRVRLRRGASRRSGSRAPTPRRGRRRRPPRTWCPSLRRRATAPTSTEVARAHGLSEARSRSRATPPREYTAFMLGLHARLRLPRPAARRSSRRRGAPTPRAARARGLGGHRRPPDRRLSRAPRPGGWNLIGRTALRLFDPLARPAGAHPARRPRALRRRRRAAAAGAASAAPRGPRRGAPPLEVLEAGLLTTVQDAGRPGYRRARRAAARGRWTARALAAANRAVGNPRGRGRARVHGRRARACGSWRPTRFAVAGADLGAVLERADLGAWPVPRGRGRARAARQRPRASRRRRSGCRAYVALRGRDRRAARCWARARPTSRRGFGGLDGRAAARGRPARRRPRAPASGRRPPPRRRAPPRGDGRRARGRRPAGRPLHRRGPRARFLERGLARRAPPPTASGCRLEGPPPRARGAAEIVTDGMVPGCVQVPPDGQPIVMLADGPTTGGYPKIATVVTRRPAAARPARSRRGPRPVPGGAIDE